MPGTPSPNIPHQLQFLSIDVGRSATAEGGGLPRASGSVTVRLDGDTARVFSIDGLQVLELVRDPDAPSGSPRVWETVASADGAGPIDMGPSGALLIVGRFNCPNNPGQDTFTATASVVTPDSPQPHLQVPLRATVSPGKVSIAPLVTPALSAGGTEEFRFRLSSSLRHDVAGIFTCDTADPDNPFSSDTNPQFPSLPAGSAQEVALPVSCKAGTPIGEHLAIFNFKAIDNSALFAQQQVTIVVGETRSVAVAPSLIPGPLAIDYGFTRLGIRATVSGGKTTFNLTPGPGPTGISFVGGAQSVAVDGSVVTAITIQADVPAVTGKQPSPLVLNWSVPADEFHAEVSGSLAYDITLPKRRILFGLESFQVVNCRSKGDHNDVDTLYVTVTSNRDAFPTTAILLGNNLHAGDPPVFNQFAGPFEIDDGDLVSASYNVVNGAMGADDTTALGLKIGAAVLEAVAGLEEAHFLGLVASSIEKGLFSAVGAVFGGLGELLGITSSNPDCSGAVASRTIPIDKGQFAGGPQRLAPTDPEVQQSPSKCGNNPHSNVVYLAKQIF